MLGYRGVVLFREDIYLFETYVYNNNIINFYCLSVEFFPQFLGHTKSFIFQFKAPNVKI